LSAIKNTLFLTSGHPSQIFFRCHDYNDHTLDHYQSVTVDSWHIDNHKRANAETVKERMTRMVESLLCANPTTPFELLVVDDDQGQLQSLQQLLHTSGYTNVKLASGGDEAITKLQNNTPHLILLDLQMPGIDGLKVLEFHQQTGLASEIVIISGETSFHWVKEAMRLGAHDFIRKPYKPEELLTAIVKALDQFQEKRHQRAEKKYNANSTIDPDTLSPEAIKRPETESGFQPPSQELAYPQAFFSPFFEQANYLAGVLDHDMHLLEVNLRALQVIEQPAQAVIGQPFINTPWWCEEDKPRLSEALDRAAAGQADTFVATHSTACGRPLSVQFSVLPVNVGDELYVKVMGLDISERIHHQHELTAQRRRLSDILEQAHVGTWKWNVQTGETLFSERWAEIIGYRLEELDPVSVDTWKQLTHPDDLKASGKLLEKHFHRESPYYECEARRRHKDGHWVWVLDRGMIAAWTDDGKPLLMSGINQDITERKQAEEALRESETKYRRLIENTHDIIYSLTPEGVFTYVSPAWTILLGHPVTEVEGHLFTEFVHPDDQPVCFAFLQKVLAGQRQEGVEYRIQHINGEWRWHTSNATPVKDTDGLVIGYEGISSDITERKQAQLSLEQKNQELEQLAYSVSHDLKSPLITVKTYAGMLRQDLQNGDQPQINQDLNYIDKAADKIQQLLDALLQYSRIGTVDTQAQTLSADQAVEDCLAALAGILQKHDVKVSNSELNQQLHGNPLYFAQVWQNLIENSVKYSGDQPHPLIEIGAMQQGQDVVFYVRDNGIGIAPEHNDRIFNLFSQLNQGSEGSGLGLALVKKIISIYQGRIWVESAGEGQGSCFMFTLPGALVNRKATT